MIKAKKGKLVVNGHPMELLNEYKVITKQMVEMLDDGSRCFLYWLFHYADDRSVHKYGKR